MKIICIGRNYAAHAAELKNDVPSEPVIFMKPDSALIPKGHPFYHPEFTKDLHHEIEVVVKINRVGKHIEERFAHKYYSEIGLGIDFTARDMQQECKEKGLPWEKAKAWDHSAPLGEKFIPVSEIGDVTDIDFHLEKNGEVVQKGNTSDMLFSINRIIMEVSKYFTLKIGDLIYTGTPAGVSKVEVGDRLVGFIGDQKMIEVKIK